MASSPSPPGCTTGGRSRFSSTLRLAKIPRSSGQKASPRRAIRLEGRPISSSPRKRTEPPRRGTMPITDLSVVVLPAPLRPSRVTTSPARTSKSTPWSTCDSPYQAWSPATCRRVSLMPDPQVRLHDVRIGGHRRVVALGQDLPPGQHRDGVGEVLHHAQVVLH